MGLVANIKERIESNQEEMNRRGLFTLIQGVKDLSETKEDIVFESHKVEVEIKQWRPGPLENEYPSYD